MFPDDYGIPKAPIISFNSQHIGSKPETKSEEIASEPVILDNYESFNFEDDIFEKLDTTTLAPTTSTVGAAVPSTSTGV